MNVRGRVVAPEDLAKIQSGIGTLDKEKVESLIGPPSSVLSFDSNTWYYFNLFTETSAFFSPSVIENKGFVLLFTSDGKLSKYIPNSGAKEFEVALKETILPSKHRKEFLTELFKNAGRFGKKAKKKSKAS